MRIKCPHYDVDIEAVQEEQLPSCPSCGGRLHFLDDTLLYAAEEH